MIYFDSTSIFNKALEKLQQDPNWKIIANNSVVSAILKSNSEIQAETARYAEYLFQESKWDTAQNASSILSMSNMLGYQPKRKISARGQIYISADPRTHLVGKTISSYMFENLMNADDTTPWQTLSENYSITSSVNITDDQGNSYIAIPSAYRSYTKVATLSIIQGKRKSTYINLDTIRNTSTISKFDPYLYIPITIKDCEDASNSTSKAYFRVYLIFQSGEVREYRVVDTLLLSGSSDYDVEVYNDLYSQELFYLKFNNDPTRGKTLDISKNSSLQYIRIDYIESLGDAGNVYDTFRNFTVTDIPGHDGNLSGIKLYGINLEPIAGGKDEETVAEVKVNAPKNYINSYTAGTKEAYETAIANMDILIGNTIQRPSKVQVYGGIRTDAYGNQLPVTCITFLSDNLEDIVTGVTTTDEDEDPYKDIERSLNYYLYRLKSPQDTLVFVPPNYIAFALGLKCKIAKESTDDITQLEMDIRDFVDTQWGSGSDNLDFERNFYPSQIVRDVMNGFTSVTSITTEVEAIKRLDWMTAERKSPKPSSDSNSTTIHTMRIPFTFDKIFLGQQSTKGFKDYRVGSDYVMRIDFMYKKPKQMTDSTNYHVSIFLQDGRTLRNPPELSDELTDAFYYMKDTSQSGIWPDTFTIVDRSDGSTATTNADGVEITSDYEYLKDVSVLQRSQQYYYRPMVYSDNDYRALIGESSQESTPTISSYLVNPGAIDDYLIYFSADYEDDSDTIADGWIELTFDPLYKMLASFSSYDSQLQADIQNCPLALLKCNNSDITDNFNTFLKLLDMYVDVYVCMRPIDPDLQIDLNSVEGGSTVLYIDTKDSTSIGNATNLSVAKKERMASVSCEFED